MTIQTFAPAVSPFARDPFYAMGVADAYDEYAAGEDIHVLKRRAEEMVDADTHGSIPAELYLLGYATNVIGLMNGHIAQINAQTEVAQTWLDRKQGRATAALHTRHQGRAA
ncbi:hypothetical protein [Streptomyces pseudovenezuelae]|uniref:hypothetical protein n=1 Tax=Streptomyces pseudovenezuelae TaxID=67350 RepID=UPI002E80A494|nr:hypothetical protein [Streptomyces pseudovenezuelae]WUA94524.1 hypothetical protein OHO81_44935 [Streptomyces pseudovenezuelae]